jgi:hypothetical protein
MTIFGSVLSLTMILLPISAKQKTKLGQRLLPIYCNSMLFGNQNE